MRVQLRGVIALGAVLALGCNSNDLGLSIGSGESPAPSGGESSIQYRGTCSEVITFEGLDNGAWLTDVFSDGGAGPIHMMGTNPDLPGENAAIVFDSSNPLPAADDYDLGSPNETFGGPGVGEGGEMGQPYENNFDLGNIAIVGENLTDTSPADGNVDVPDDALDGVIEFDFSDVGTGVVTVCEMEIVDVEAIETPATVDLYGPGGAFITQVVLPQTGDNGAAIASLGPTAGVEKMVVTLNGSGGIDNIAFEPEEPPGGGEGCTPGYWKNHHEDWEGYTPGQTVGSVFSGASNFPTLADDSLDTALRYGGGPGLVGMAQNLLRIGVASLLNASSSNVDYPYSVSELIDSINDALESNSRRDMRDLKNELDGTNNDLPCPL